MPEQNVKFNTDYVIASGFFLFISVSYLLSAGYHGVFLELIPYSLIFCASLTVGAFTGLISANHYVRYLELLLGFSVLFFFRRPECFALVSGFLSGCFSSELFAHIADGKSKKVFCFQYLSCGIIGVALFIWFGFSVLLITAYFFVIAVLYLRKITWLNVTACFLSIILLTGSYYLSGKYQEQDSASETEAFSAEMMKNVFMPQIYQSGKEILQIQPVNSKTESLKSEFKLLDQNSRNQSTVLSYSSSGNILNDIRLENNVFSIIVVELIPENSFLMSKEFISQLKTKLKANGRMYYFLMDRDLQRAAALRAALSKSFRYVQTAGGIPMISASDQPLQLLQKSSSAMILKEMFYSRDFEEQTVVLSEKIPMPSCYSNDFERMMMRQSENPLLKMYAEYLPLPSTVFYCVIAGLFFLYLLFRYFMAYIPDMGLRLTVYRDSVLLFLVPGMLCFSKNLTCSTDANSYIILIAVLAIAFHIGKKIPVRFAKYGIYGELILIVISAFALQDPGYLLYPNILFLTGFAGILFPMMLQGSLEKYKTGTSSDANLFPYICSGLLTSAVLLAMMPDHLYFGSMLP